MSTETKGHLSPADCKNCKYRISYASDVKESHCYMFQFQPEGDYCGQFKRVGIIRKSSTR